MSDAKNMNDKAAEAIMERLDAIDTTIATMDSKIAMVDEKMVTKADIFQSVLTVQGFTFAIIVGVVVVLNSIIGFG